MSDVLINTLGAAGLLALLVAFVGGRFSRALRSRRSWILVAGVLLLGTSFGFGWRSLVEGFRAGRASNGQAVPDSH